jgi:hypothetical protein
MGDDEGAGASEVETLLGAQAIGAAVRTIVRYGRDRMTVTLSGILNLAARQALAALELYTELADQSADLIHGQIALGVEEVLPRACQRGLRRETCDSMVKITRSTSEIRGCAPALDSTVTGGVETWPW